MSNIDKRALRDSAESTINILESISGFEPSDIDGDTVELRFETEDGFDTGCDVSIVDQCQKAADVVRALLDELEVAEKRNGELVHNHRVHAARLIDERGQLKQRIAELEAREVKLPKPISVLHRREFTDAHRSIYAYPEAEVNAALADAGIRIQGQD